VVSGVRGEAKQLVKEIRGALQNLSEKEQEILRLRFGLGSRKHGPDEVGALIGVTQSRVRRMEGRALRKLRVAALEGSMDANGLDQVLARNDAVSGNGRSPRHRARERVSRETRTLAAHTVARGRPENGRDVDRGLIAFCRSLF